MNRIDLSNMLFSVALKVRVAPTTLRLAAERGMRRLTRGLATVLCDLGAAVRGCGCDDDDPECCRRRRQTNRRCQDWCLCDCHDANTRREATANPEN